MARLLSALACIASIVAAAMVEPALSIEGPASSQDRPQAGISEKPHQTLAWRLTCQLLCAQQQAGVRFDVADRKIYQQCFAQTLCRGIELGPPVVAVPRSRRYPGPDDVGRSLPPYGPFPDGRV